MSKMQIVINIDKGLYTRLFDLHVNVNDMIEMQNTLAKGTRLKEGHWIKMPLIEAGQNYSHECSLCGRRILITDVGLSEFPYCHCGAKMESEE